MFINSHQDTQQYNSTFFRLLWLEDDFLVYFHTWARHSPGKRAFLTEATYEALFITTQSTVNCIRHLLDCGFQYVLSGKFSSDAVESLFSNIRQLNGANDCTDARAAVSALQKVLVTGVIQGAPSGNVKAAREPFSENCGPLFHTPTVVSENESSKDFSAHLLQLSMSGMYIVLV